MQGDRRQLIVLIFSVVFLGLPVRSPAEPLPPEVEAIRAEREQQRAALDRIRRKVKALQAAEAYLTPAEREQDERIRAARQLLPETPASTADPTRERARQEAIARESERQAATEREQTARERAAWQSVRDAAAAREREREQVALRERARQQEEARRLVEEREREARRLEAERARERIAARKRQERSQTLLFSLFAIYGALCFLPFFPLYRDFIEYNSKRSDSGWSSVARVVSAGCFLGAVWMSDTVSFTAIPDSLLILWFLGLYFWFFVPGLVARFLIFLHSLFVPHPLETAFQRVLRGETISRDEAARVADAIRTFHQGGHPADWRVRSALSRLERLAKLMGHENAFVDFLSEYILHHHERNESGRRH